MKTTKVKFGSQNHQTSFRLVTHRMSDEEKGLPNEGILAIFEVTDPPQGQYNFVSCYYYYSDYDLYVVAYWETLEAALSAFNTRLRALCLEPETLRGFVEKEEFTDGDLPWFFG